MDLYILALNKTQVSTVEPRGLLVNLNRILNALEHPTGPTKEIKKESGRFEK